MNWDHIHIKKGVQNLSDVCITLIMGQAQILNKQNRFISWTKFFHYFYELHKIHFKKFWHTNAGRRPQKIKLIISSINIHQKNKTHQRQIQAKYLQYADDSYKENDNNRDIHVSRQKHKHKSSVHFSSYFFLFIVK